MVEVSGWRSEREREAPGGGVRTRRGDEKRKKARCENGELFAARGIMFGRGKERVILRVRGGMQLGGE